MIPTSRAAAPIADRRNAPTWAFLVGLVVAVPVILHAGRSQWFYFDDWYFLESTDALGVSDLMDPYWGHWCLLPRLAHSLLFTAFGITSYLPFQLLVVAAHLAVSSLLWVVLRRAGVPPWIATAGAVFLLFFGPGREDIVWAFQVTLTGGVALGLAQLVLADHDGPIGRRDAAGVAFGLLAVATANTGVLLVLGTGTAVLLRRGGRAALVQCAPIAAAYLLWWSLAGREPTPLDFGAQSFGQFLDYAWGLVRDFVDVVGPGPTGLVWAALTILGVATMLPGLRSTPRWSASAGLLVSGVAFLVMVSYQRAGSLDDSFVVDPAPNRYAYLLAVFSLPTAAIGCARLVGEVRWRIAVAVVAVAACLPANIAALSDPEDPALLGDEVTGLTAADVATAFEEVPTERIASLAMLRDLGWVIDLDARGRIPDPPTIDELRRAEAFKWIVFEPPPPDESPVGCEPVADPTSVALEVGDVLQVRLAAGPGDVTVVDVDRDLHASFPTDGAGALDLAVSAGPLTAEVTAGEGADLRRCRP